MSKQVDLVLRNRRNELVTVEIAHTTGKFEAHSALHCLMRDDVVKHVVVCLTKKTLDEVKESFSRFPELGGNKRIEVISLARALGDWEP